MSSDTPLTRRRFLHQAFAFSAAAALTSCGQSGTGSTSSPTGPAQEQTSHILMVGDWGTDTTPASQAQVASAMQAYVASQKISTGALFMLGDNFYGALPNGAASSRWQTQFEQIYPASMFNCPAYAVLGNHDYQVSPLAKVDAELAYGQGGSSRWTMPSRYYRFTFPAQNPVVTFIALDSNMPNEPAQPPPPDPSYFTQDANSAAAQLQWLTESLSESLTTPFLSVIAHHPVYSNGPHGDNQTLVRTWDPLLRQHGVHLYLAGHDHDLQHLEFAGHPTSFVLSGAGGAPLGALKTAEASRGPFAQEVSGFTHLQLQSSLMTIRHVNSTGTILHGFTKTPGGVVTILA